MPRDAEQIDRLNQSFAAQKTAFLANPMPTLDQRIDGLRRIRDMVLSHKSAFLESMKADFTTIHPRMVDMMDTGPVLGRVDYFEKNLAEWMKPKRIEPGPEHGSSTAQVLQVPKGVNGNISPWNFPIESALVMCVDMLAAGNTVIVKPSELAPATGQALEEAVAEHFDPTELTVIQGGLELAEAFAAMPWDHLTFTGSPRVGQIVAEAAAKNLVPTTLELGGKNPAVFASDGVTAELIDLFLRFRTLKSGQVCTSPDYALVPRDHLESWLEVAGEQWRKIYPKQVGHPFTTGIINEPHYRRLLGYIEEARDRGARVVGLNDDEPDEALRQIPTTLIVDPPEDLACMTDEVFGPVIPVVPYDSVDSMIEQLNSGPSPLASYLATYDETLASRFVHTVQSGGAAVNCFGLQGGHVALPFGGFGRSGHGCHSGYEGFLNYSHTKSVFYGEQDSFVHKVLEPMPSDFEAEA